MIPKFVPQKISGDAPSSQEFVLALEQVARVLSEIGPDRRPQLSGEILDGDDGAGVDLTTGSETLVEHKLGRALRGWRLVDIQADARVWRDTTTTSDATKYLALQCSANVTVKIEVF